MASSKNSCGIVNTPWGENVWVCACIGVCATKSYITKNFNTGSFVQNIQHLIFLHPKVAPKESWESADGRIETRGTLWHPRLWKLLEQQFAKFLGPLYMFQNYSSKPFPLLAVLLTKGTGFYRYYIFNIPSHFSHHTKLGFGPLQYTPPL